MFRRGSLVRIEGDENPIPWTVTQDQTNEDVLVYNSLTRESLSINGSFVHGYRD